MPKESKFIEDGHESRRQKILTDLFHALRLSVEGREDDRWLYLRRMAIRYRDESIGSKLQEVVNRLPIEKPFVGIFRDEHWKIKGTPKND